MHNTDFERDLFASASVLSKIHTERYAQHLYAALCNSELHHHKTGHIAKYSWRSAAALIAELELRQGPQVNAIFDADAADYMRWYCSGIFRSDDNQYVGEGTITSEIRIDLFTLGWDVIPVRRVEGEPEYV